MLWLNWSLALVALLVGPALLVVAWRYSRRSNPILIDVQQRVGEVAEMAEESAVGIRVIKAFGREADRTESFGRTASRAFDRSMDAARLASFYQPLMGFLPTLGVGVVLAYGGVLAIDGDEPGRVRHLLPLPDHADGALPLAGVPGRTGAARRRRRDPPVRGARLGPELREAEAAEPLPAGPGAVRLEGVSFAYAPGGRGCSTGSTSTCRAGARSRSSAPRDRGRPPSPSSSPASTTSAPGACGWTASTCADLRLNDLRRAVGVVPQNPFLFSTTVRENIAYGRPEATDAEVRAAARMAQAEGFIDALPDGFDTVVGERGFTLSGGQRQRIAIARALITDPRVLILDEATASVDASTEREIQAALRAVMAGRTTIVIAHRLSTLSLADELVVLEEGRIVARGTHEELHETSDLYREIHDGGLARPDLIARDA